MFEFPIFSWFYKDCDWSCGSFCISILGRRSFYRVLFSDKVWGVLRSTCTEHLYLTAAPQLLTVAALQGKAILTTFDFFFKYYSGASSFCLCLLAQDDDAHTPECECDEKKIKTRGKAGENRTRVISARIGVWQRPHRLVLLLFGCKSSVVSHQSMANSVCCRAVRFYETGCLYE